MFFLTTPQENVSIQSIQQYFNAFPCGEAIPAENIPACTNIRPDKAERPGHSASSHSFFNGL